MPARAYILALQGTTLWLSAIAINVLTIDLLHMLRVCISMCVSWNNMLRMLSYIMKCSDLIWTIFYFASNYKLMLFPLSFPQMPSTQK